MGAVRERGRSALGSFAAFARDIKLAHSVFAMPFAMAAFVVGRLPLPDVRRTALLAVCMVTARSFAMGMNRYLDRHIDRVNPRTQGRMIPKGEMTAGQALGWSLAAAFAFAAGAFQLSPLAGYCAVPLLAILMAYSFMKRLSWTTHWYLGFCLGLAPIAVEIAMIGEVTWPIVLMGLAVTFWTAGFDILYSLQDMEFDRAHGLRSVPGRFGPVRSLWLSRLCFVAMIGLLTSVGTLAGGGAIYYLGVAAVAGILTYEHVLVRDARETGVSKNLGVAFFNVNAYVSVAFLGFAALDLAIRS